MKKSLIRSSLMLIVLSLLSKVLGLAREMIMAFFYGATNVTDAYVVAQSCTALIVSGLTSYVVLGLVRTIIEQKEDHQSIGEIVNSTLLLTCVIASIAVLVMICVPEWLIKIFASRFDKSSVEITSSILVSMAPMLVFQAFASTIRGYLETQEDFFITGIANIVLNFFIIIGVILSNGHVWLLGMGWTMGQFAICLVSYLRARQYGLRLRKYKPKRLNDPIMQGLLAMVIPLFLGSLLNELNPIIDRNFASALGEGTISSMNYAFRVNAVFLSLVVASVTSVLFPRLSKLAVESSMLEYKMTASKVQNMLQLIAIPAAIGIALLAEPLVSILYYRGRFDALAMEITANTLRLYALLIPINTISAVYWPCFSAIKYTKGLVVSGMVMVAVNICLNFLLIKPMGYQGLALATVLANLCGMTCGVVMLRRRIGSLGLRQFLSNIIKMGVASGVMGVVVYFLREPAIGLVSGMTSFIRIVILAILALAGIIVYISMAKLLRIKEIDEVFIIVKGLLKK